MKKKQNSHTRRSQPQASSPANLTYYVVVLIAGLSGFMSYSAGSSLERALTRVVIVLIACTILGYFINMALLLAAPGRSTAAATTSGAGDLPAGTIGARVDLVAGDDDEELSATRGQPVTHARSAQAAG